MSLPVPNLDDRNYDQLTAEALALIPRNLPQWTDYNPSDPGVTLLELFAFVIEAGIYQINRVPDRSLRRFVELLGVSPLSGETTTQTLLRAQQTGAVRNSAITQSEFERLATQVAVLQLTVQSVAGTTITVAPFNTAIAYPQGTQVAGSNNSVSTTLAQTIPANTSGITQISVVDATFASALQVRDSLTIAAVGRAKALVQVVPKPDSIISLAVQSVVGATISVAPFDSGPSGLAIDSIVMTLDRSQQTLLAQRILADRAEVGQVSVKDQQFAAALNPGDRVLVSVEPTVYPPDEQIKVIVIPTPPAEDPTEVLREMVYEFLRTRCLIATSIKISPPDYSYVSIAATVVRDSGSRLSQTIIGQSVTDALANFLSPLTGGMDGKGWEFGRSVFRSELYELIQKVAGVDHVQRLLLNGDEILGELPLSSAFSLVRAAPGSPQVTVVDS